MEIENHTGSWKKIERFFGIIGFVAAIAATVGVYYQFQSKKCEVQFVILSKDYLTVKNNVEGLESNFKYSGEQVKNLWLVKFKIINSGDVTLVGTENSSSLLDSIITFHFNGKVQLLDKLNLIANNFPEHTLMRKDFNNLTLSFKQWRPNESATYSVYIKSNISDPSLTPSSSRVIKDGNIIVDDLTKNKPKIKVPLLDSILNNQAALIARILGFILSGLLLLAILLFTFGLMLPEWFKLRFWLWRNSENFKSFIQNFDASKIKIQSVQNDFVLNRKSYLKNPTSMTIATVWNEWKTNGFEKIPDTENSPTNWKQFSIFMLVIITLIMCTVSIILGLLLS